MTLGRRAKRLFEDYDHYHRNRYNKLTHVIGIPLIVVSLFALLGLLTIWGMSAAQVLVLFAAVYYIWVDIKVGALFVLILIPVCHVSELISPAIAISMFVVGWVLQLIGHYIYEKNSPAFYTNLLQLLIGPLWLFARAMRLH